MYYNRHKNNKYSQNGEDGVLSVLLAELKINPKNSWVVDVGAYDGVSYSNVRKIIDVGANAVMIEPMLVGGVCESKYETLKNLSKILPNVHTFNVAIVPTHYNEKKRNEIRGWFREIEESCGKFRKGDVEMCSLDDILKRTHITNDYDILNIDTDYCDHEIWIEHKKYKPKIVIIEVNSGILPAVAPHEIPINSSEKGPLASFGYSLIVAKSMGYSLVCHIGNMIYVRNDLLKMLSIPKEKINSNELFNRRWV